MTKRKRQVHLIAEEHVEKAWAAALALGGDTTWISLDDIGDFLRMRQLDAAAVKFEESDPNTRYALQPRLTKWKRGWEDAVIATAVSRGLDYEFFEHRRVDSTHMFRAKKDPDSLWKMKNTSVPTSPKWASPRVAS